jgi:hypothetical protein
MPLMPALANTADAAVLDEAQLDRLALVGDNVRQLGLGGGHVGDLRIKPRAMRQSGATS